MRSGMTGTAVAAHALVLYATLISPCVWAKDYDFAAERHSGDAALEQDPFLFAYFPSLHLIRVAHRSERPGGPVGRFRIVDSRGAELYARDVSGESEWSAKIPDLRRKTEASGDGGYVAEFRPAVGAEIQRVAFRRDVFDWEGNGVGRSDVVPEPFLPISIGRNGRNVPVVRTVLREHELNSLGLLSQVVSAGEAILAAPMRIEYDRGDERRVLEGNGFAFDFQGKSKARGHASFDDGNIRGTITGEWSLDGMLDCRLTIESGAVDRLHLVIPLKAKHARLMHAVTDAARINYAGAIPDGDGIVWHGGMAKRTAMVGDYVSYLWVGGPLRGLSVFGENDRGFVRGKWTCQDIRRTADGSVEIRIGIVQDQKRFDRPLTVRLGFLATPVKPMPQDWRKERLVHEVGGCWYWGCQTPCNDLVPRDGSYSFVEKMAEARETGRIDAEFLERYAAGYRHSPLVDEVSFSNRLSLIRRQQRQAMVQCAESKKLGTTLAFYTNARGLNLNSAPGSTFCDEWLRFRYVNRPAADVDDSCAYDLDPVSSYRDWAAVCWKRLLTSGACDAIYIDDVFPAPNYDTETTDAFFTADGVLHPASGIFNMRELVMRCAVTMRELNLDFRKNVVHMTNTAIAPISAFAGVNYDWEDNGASNHLQERYSRDSILAQTIGRQFGVRSRVMGYFDGAMPNLIEERLDTGLGVVLTHELDWPRVARWNEVRRKLLDWGYGAQGTSVWNYWDTDGYPLSVEGVESSSLLMKRADGEVLAIVSSWSREPSFVRLCPRKGLLPKEFVARDFLSDEAVAVDGGAVAFELGAFRWRAVRMSCESLARRTDPGSVVVERRFPVPVPWATELKIESLDGGGVAYDFVREGDAVLRGIRGSRWRVSWCDPNGQLGSADFTIR